MLFKGWVLQMFSQISNCAGKKKRIHDWNMADNGGCDRESGLGRKGKIEGMGYE